MERAVERGLERTAHALTADAAGWREFVQGQQARRAGHADEARQLRRARPPGVPAIAPFAGYELVCTPRRRRPVRRPRLRHRARSSPRARWRQQVEAVHRHPGRCRRLPRRRPGQARRHRPLQPPRHAAESTVGETARFVEREPAGPARRNALIAVLESSAELSPT
ncbi:MAG: hypothetical protein U0736_18490 [Gemmataceae bacterium]